MFKIIVKKVLPIVVTCCYVVCSGTELTRINADINCEMNNEFNTSTEELLDDILEYPYLADMFCFNTPEMSLEHFSNNSELFNIFYSREDSIETTINKYRDYEVDLDILLNEAVNNGFEESGYWGFVFMQLYLYANANNLTTEELMTVEYLENQKYEEMKSLGVDVSEVYMIKVIPEYSLLSLGGSDIRTINTTGFVSNGYLVQNPTNGAYCYPGYYYQYGTCSFTYKYDSGDLTPTDVTQYKLYIQYNHPGYVYDADPTRKYNCHSYAWISTDTDNNDYWLNSPAQFYNTSYFHLRNNNGLAKVNDIIVIKNSSGYTEHSAIVTTAGSTYTAIRVKSKLGTHGVYYTSLYDMMGLYNGSTYSVYKHVYC